MVSELPRRILKQRRPDKRAVEVPPATSEGRRGEGARWQAAGEGEAVLGWASDREQSVLWQLSRAFTFGPAGAVPAVSGQEEAFEASWGSSKEDHGAGDCSQPQQ
ncbi:uncharacterized protein O3Q21_015917 [Podargus strigoides]